MKANVSLIGLAVTLAGLTQTTMAQVVPDGTIPSNVTSLDRLNFTINGGARSSGNLFHSFQEFSVPTGSSAIFNNALDVQNIFSRVTGSNPSQIDGLLRSAGSANFFLLNPNGVLLGANARLSIGGAFIGTTANSIQFADGLEFSGVNPTPPLLSMSVPIGLQFGSQPATMTVQGNGHRFSQVGIGTPTRTGGFPRLTYSPNRTFALVGGNLNLNGADILAPGGLVELGAVGDNAFVGLRPVPQGFSLDYGNVSQFGQICLFNRASVDVSGFGSISPGSVQVRGRSLTLSQGSQFFSMNAGNQSGQHLQFDLTESIGLQGVGTDGYPSRIETGSVGQGNGSDIRLSAPKITMQDGAVIRSAIFGGDNNSNVGGNILIRANGSLQVQGWSPFDPGIQTAINTASFGPLAGNIQIDTPNLSILDGGLIASAAFFKGTGGQVIVNATDVQLSGFNPFAITGSVISSSGFGSGKNGSLLINTKRLSARDGASLSSNAFGSGDGGSVIVNATDSVRLQGTISLPVRVQRTSINASSNTASLELRLRLNAPSQPSGNAGSVTVNTPSLNILDGATIGVRNEGIGNGGTITLNIDRLALKNQGSLRATTVSGTGGNVIITARESVLLRDTGSISATAGVAGDGGNVQINSPVILGLKNSDIVANALLGRGGNIQIITQGLIGLQNRPQLTDASDITASSEFGINGTVDVNTIGIDPNSGLTTLPVDIVDPSQKIATGCAQEQTGSFIVTGRGGVPDNPINHTNTNQSWHDLRNIINSSQLHSGMQTSITMPPATIPMVEATAWQRNANGAVEILVSNSNNSIPQTIVTCVPN